MPVPVWFPGVTVSATLPVSERGRCGTCGRCFAKTIGHGERVPASGSHVRSFLFQQKREGTYRIHRIHRTTRALDKKKGRHPARSIGPRRQCGLADQAL